MTRVERDIHTDDYKIQDLVKELGEDKFLIPTFQRDFVWDPQNILNLWDSIYKFYPIGSILYWETDTFLHTHRKLGGFEFPHDEDTVREFKDWRYVLDGQQRITSLLVSLKGGTGRVEGNEKFDYTLYFDATKAEFLFGDKREERIAAGCNPAFLLRVRDVPTWPFSFYKDISSVVGFSAEIEANLARLQRIFTHYVIPVVRIRGVEVKEVCDIFERINQEGKKLDPVDIMVARTYRREDPEKGIPAFYLRDNLDALL